jgi:hypothetical protein
MTLLAIVEASVRSTLGCGGSTPTWHNTEVEDEGGVRPPHSRVLRTAIFAREVEGELMDKAAVGV